MERKLGDIATRVIFENERVRIWEMRMPPGESSPPHRHALDHILVQISGDRRAPIASTWRPTSRPASASTSSAAASRSPATSGSASTTRS
jgi:hypothetical protein